MSVDKTQHPIFQAVKDGNLQQVKSYLAEGIDVDIRDDSTFVGIKLWTPGNGHVSNRRFDPLAEHGADINSQYDAGNTPLMVASWQGHLEVVQYLEGIGADLHLVNKGGCTALSSAAEHGHLEIVKFLVEHDVNTIVLKGGRALTDACEWGGHVEVVKYLISKGANIEGEANRDGFTPLVAAAYQGHIDLVKLLLSCGVDMHVAHGAPLEWAALFDQFGTVHALLGAGADPDEKIGHDNTALISAASERSNERVTIIKALLDAGADVNGRGVSGVTALHEAAASGRFDVVELLLESGADITLQDDDGNTAALRATEAGQLKVLCLLVKRGTDLDHSNKQGKTAREILSKMMLSLTEGA